MSDRQGLVGVTCVEQSDWSLLPQIENEYPLAEQAMILNNTHYCLRGGLHAFDIGEVTCRGLAQPVASALPGLERILPQYVREPGRITAALVSKRTHDIL